MQFRTEIDLPPAGFVIDHAARGIAVGSCFAENMARRMMRGKFPVVCNPFGVLFNPLSIADSLEDITSRRLFTPDDLCERDGVWSSFSFHGSFSSHDPHEALGRMNRAVTEGADALQVADYVILTLGTAWVYELVGGGGVAANCHKFPAETFRRRRLGVGEIVERYSRLLEGPLAGKRVIFTVSPVRHLKDGFAENTLSKAVLIESVHELCAAFEGALYFPAFEIMNDDLRDYRFYSEDMVHPSPVAVDYIWERFRDWCVTPSAAALCREIEGIAAAMDHRPLKEGSLQWRSFCRAMHAKVMSLASRCPQLDFRRELDYFASGKD